MMDIKFEGDWAKVQRLLKKLPDEVKRTALYGQKKAADKLVKIAKGHINNQDLGWAARAETTRVNDPRILVSSGDYLDAIKSWRSSNLYYAGVPTAAYNSRGIRIADYAVYHEYGFGNNPIRALWGPSFEEIGGGDGMRLIMLKILQTKLRRMGL